MKFNIHPQIKHILILGAGASVDYGLPVWKDLGSLIKKSLTKPTENIHQHEEDILTWVDKVGDGKKYDTIDRCITEESRSKKYHSNGLIIENCIFSIIKNIFKESYKECGEAWLSTLNRKILDKEGLENEIAFINYNYDHVLDDNLLHFEFLNQKEREVDYRKRIESLSNKYIEALYPHGNFFLEQELGKFTHVNRLLNTKKSDLKNRGIIDAVSCYESEKCDIKKYGYNPVNLYILGLGGGLYTNLNNVSSINLVSEIHVTIKDEAKRNEIIKFLSEKYSLTPTEINIYPTCEELIDKCFNN
jgi:hypothetical protein